MGNHGTWIVAIVVALMGIVSARAEDPAVPGGAQVGINIAGLGPITTQWDFVDLIKNMDAWHVPGGAKLSVDANGWPTAIPAGADYVGTFVRLRLTPSGKELHPSYPAGQYTLTWKGKGRFSLDGAGVVSAVGEGSKPVSYAQGDQNIYLKIDAIDPSDPLRDLHLYMPGYGPGEAHFGEVFHQRFIDMVKPFGTIRFMDWMVANKNNHETWSQRPKPDDARYSTSGGVPVEHMVALANLTRCNAWFNMPVLADDDYVRQFAVYVRDHLDRDLKAYVEYGNEIFIVGGELGRYIHDQPAENGEPAWTWPKYWAKEAARDFAIWSEVFMEQPRLVRVAAAQTGNRWASPRFFDFLDGQFDAIAMGAYISPAEDRRRTYDASTTPEQIIRDTREALLAAIDRTKQPDIDGSSRPEKSGYLLGAQQSKGEWAYMKQLADYFSKKLGRPIPLIAYEGGQSILPGHVPNAFDGESSWYEAYAAAQRHPQMKQLYREMLTSWFRDVGGDQFMAFSSVGSIAPWGAWGMLERQDQPVEEAPKYEAIMDQLRNPNRSPDQPR